MLGKEIDFLSELPCKDQVHFKGSHFAHAAWNQRGVGLLDYLVFEYAPHKCRRIIHLYLRKIIQELIAH